MRKGTDLKKKLKSGKEKNVQLLLEQLQTSDHRFRVISALVNAASPEKVDRNAKLSHLGDNEYPPAEIAHSAIAYIGRSILI